jgi:hypothetical protein
MNKYKLLEDLTLYLDMNTLEHLLDIIIYTLSKLTYQKIRF